MKGIPEQANEAAMQGQVDQQIYLDALQLNRPPFANDTNPSTAFISEQWQQNIDQLTHLVQSSDLLLAVSAEHGLGKSTLSRLFIQHAGSHLRCCSIEVTKQLTEHQLLVELAHCLDLPAENDDPTLLAHLLEQANDLQRNDTQPVVILDNAQLLPANTLEQLLQLHTASNNQSGRFRILLFSTPELTTRLIQMQSHLHVIQLTPLDEQATADYLQHKLRQAGYKHGQIFTDKDVKFIQQHARGNMEQINLLAHQVLLNKYTRTDKIMNNKQQQKANFLRKPEVWISITVVIILSIVLFFQGQINQLVEPSPENESILAQPSFRLPETKEYLLKKIPDPAPETVAGIEPETHQTSNEPIPVPPVETLSNEEPEVATPVEIISESEAESEPAAQAIEAPVSSPTTTTEPNSKPDALTASLEKFQIKDKDWIMQQPAISITAQMMASSKPDALIRQARNPALAGQAAIYQVQRKNKDWYVMVYGSYPDKTSMRKAIDNLPDTLKKGKPWIRPMSTVQAEIQSGRK